jgi:hypothetical protein
LTIMSGTSTSSTLWVVGNGFFDRVLSQRLGTRHLDRNIAACAHLPGHFVFIYVDHHERNIYLFDPLGRRYASYAGRHNITVSVNRWLHEQRIQHGRPAVADYAVVVNVDGLPTQNDAISCGAFTCLYAYYKVLFGRWPTAADFGSANHADMRVVMFDACVSGALRRELPAGGGGGGANAGAAHLYDLTDQVRSRTSAGNVNIDLADIDAGEQAAILASFQKVRASAVVNTRDRVVV